MGESATFSCCGSTTALRRSYALFVFFFGASLMSRGPQSVKQSNIAKALKGALKAGFKVHRAEIDADGRIVLDFGEQSHEAAQDFNEWDTVK